MRTLNDYVSSIFHHEGKVPEIPSAQGDFSAQLAFNTGGVIFSRLTELWSIVMGKLRLKGFAEDWELTLCL